MNTVAAGMTALCGSVTLPVMPPRVSCDQTCDNPDASRKTIDVDKRRAFTATPLTTIKAQHGTPTALLSSDSIHLKGGRSAGGLLQVGTEEATIRARLP